MLRRLSGSNLGFFRNSGTLLLFESSLTLARLFLSDRTFLSLTNALKLACLLFAPDTFLSYKRMLPFPLKLKLTLTRLALSLYPRLLAYDRVSSFTSFGIRLRVGLSGLRRRWLSL